MALAVSLFLAVPVQAHDIPARVTVLVLMKAESLRLRVLVRVPLEALRDVQFPVRGPGYLELGRMDSLLHDAALTWIAQYLEIREDGRSLGQGRLVAARVSLPSNRSFTSFDSALAHVTGPPLDPSTEIVGQQALADVLLEYPLVTGTGRMAVQPGLAHLGLTTTTVLRYTFADGTERALQYTGNPGLVEIDPRWYQAAWQFTKLGFAHILDGMDHLLFILCLVIPIRKARPLIAIVTSFTVAHSITLAAAASGLSPAGLWFPALVETLIALSIVWMALENIAGVRLERRWIMAFVFGLVHGFGFSFLLRDSLQFGGSHLALSLMTFNIGVEAGQLFVLLLAIPLLDLVYRRVVTERMGVIVLSALVAHTAWHWMTARGIELLSYRLALPQLDAAFVIALMRTLMALVVLAGVLWAMSAVIGKILRPAGEGAHDLKAGES